MAKVTKTVVSPKPKKRRHLGMGMTRKTGYYTDAISGEKLPYTYWQASREVPEKDLPPGYTRKRITGNGPSQKAAEARLQENWDAFMNGHPTPRTKVRGKQEMTVQQLWDEWHQRNMTGRVSEMMAYKYKGYFENHILPAIGRKKVRQLNEDDFLLLFGTILPSKKRPNGKELLGSNARRNIYNCLSGCFKYGVSKGYLDHNPLTTVTAPEKTKPRIDIETVSEDAKRLLAMLADEDPTDYCRWIFQFLGLRRAERLGLCWSNIRGLHTPKASMVIDQQLARYSGVLEKGPKGWYIKHQTKGKTTRTITIPEPFLTALRKHKKAQDKLKKSPDWKPHPDFADLVFLQPDGSIFTLNRDNREWHKLLETHGFPYWRGHINRHITATWLAEQSPPTPVTLVSAILGHNSEAMTFYYAKVTEALQQEPMRNYGQMIANAGRSSRPPAPRGTRRARK